MKKIEIEDFGASLADEIKKLAKAVQNTQLNDDALAILLSAKTSVNRTQIKEVLYHLRNLERDFIK